MKNVRTGQPELKTLKFLWGLYVFMFLSDYIMPQYFGVHLGYDVTCTRLANMLFIFYMIMSPDILTHFATEMTRCVITLPMVLYLFVAGYTMVFRVDVNAFFLVFFEMFSLWMLIYGVRYVLGYKRAVRWSVVCAYILSVYGLIEFACGFSLMLKFLATIPTPVRNSYRSGHYRIMGPCGHPLGYGLLLLLFVAIASIDEEKDEVFLFKRPVLQVLLLLNIFLTGSRSTLGIVVLEFALIIVFSKYENVKKTIFYFVTVVIGLALFLMVFYRTPPGQYIMMQLASLVDQFFDTEYSAAFGADLETLKNSEEYRKFLPRIFTLDWLNPILGRGVKRGFGAEFDGTYLQSIDNYYVCQYIKYAYPGLVCYVLFMFATLCSMIRGIWKYHSAVCKMTFVASFCYYFNLWWLDALQTLKYEYIVLALFYGFVLTKRDEEKKQICELKQEQMLKAQLLKEQKAN